MLLRVLCALGYEPHLAPTLPAKLAATLEDRMAEIAVKYSPAVRPGLLFTGGAYHKFIMQYMVEDPPARVLNRVL